MTTAFQPDAFQNNAFQIDGGVAVDTHDGGYKKPRGYRKQVLGNLIRIYEEAREALPKDKKLISVVDAYIEAKTPEQVDRRLSAQYIVDELPDIAKVDLDSLFENELSALRFERAIQEIEQRLALAKLKNEDDMLLIMLAAIA